MTICTNCGFELKVGQAVCPACGSAVKHAGNSSVANNVTKDFKVQTPSLFLKYADLLDNDALYQAALCKLNGISVQQNVAEAIEMFKILAFRGYHDGMYKLAECLLKLNPPDVEVACRWLAQAASDGHKPSQLLLNMMGFDVAKEQNRLGKIQDVVPSLEVLVKNALPSIVSIEVGCESNGKKAKMAGSGFIVEDGYVITNAHVIGENFSYITARFEPDVDSKSYNLVPLAIVPTLDIAVLRFTGLADKKFTSQTNFSMRLEGLEYGEDVYTIGNPLGIGLSVSKGVISCPNRASSYPPAVGEVIQTDITANHGNSGGALLDMGNNVIGMITFAPTASEGGMAMCVPASCIVAVLNKIQDLTKGERK